MAGPRLRGASFRERRLWSFGGCIFDEANWSLTVDGRRVAIETKPLELLRELLLNAGNLVSKEALLDAIWPEVEVVEASLPTAVAKLRKALGDDRRQVPIIATVPRIGYRLAVPVEVDHLNGPGAPETAAAPPTDPSPSAAASEGKGTGGRGRFHLASGLAIAIASVALAIALSRTASAPSAPQSISQQDAATALRKLDLATIERMLSAGWHPMTPFDTQGNGALNILFQNCEWDPAHDQRQMLLIARTLLDGGAQLAHRNVWGDTAYSIAKAKRYCGPDHPATKMLRTLCYAGYQPPGDRCLASYELERRERRGGS